MGTQLSCPLCNYNKLTENAKFCPNCGKRDPLIGNGVKTLGRCHVCRAKQAIDSKECTYCGKENPVRYIENFTASIKYYIGVSILLFALSPIFGILTAIISVIYCFVNPKKEEIIKPPKKKKTTSTTEQISSNPISSITKNKTEENLCQICFEMPRNTILIPCGHVGVCDICGKKLFKARGKPPCPFCTQPVERMSKMYIV